MKFEKPFPHFVSTDLFDREQLRRAVAEWPAEGWKEYETGKRALSHLGEMPRSLQTVVAGKAAYRLESLLSAELGIPNLIADDTLYGAGLHETLRGGRLGMHVDFNIHPRTKLYRRVNVILYLNDDWTEEDGGALILSNGTADEDAMISPRLGTFVAWEVGDERWHGHPDPLESESRKSIAWYFYTAEKPQGFSEKHGTIYR